MRAIIGGTVVGIEDWSYNDKDTNMPVSMMTIWLLGSSRTNDSVAVPAGLRRPEVGEDVFYVADVSLRAGRAKRDGNGTWPATLSVWAKTECTNPFADDAGTPDLKLHTA